MLHQFFCNFCLCFLCLPSHVFWSDFIGKVLVTAPRVLRYAVAGCSSAVAEFWHITTVMRAPNDMADRQNCSND